MSVQHSAPANTAASSEGRDLFAIVFCTFAWGTTWFAITMQLGVVDPVVSVTYRFALSAAMLFAWCALTRQPLALTRAQHVTAFGVGVFTFAINYALVYWAEERVTSAVVAVMFASLAFLNLIGFRIAFGQRPPMLAWAAATLGIAGVALLSWEEIASAQFGARATIGIGLTLIAVTASVVGNVFARRGEMAGTPLIASTGWAMAYGTMLLALYALISGKQWAFEPTWGYALSLFYLAAIGSVMAFVLYYGLARRRGYATASYISALAPPVAMLVSTLLEDKVWGMLALAGVVFVLCGQFLLLRIRRT